MLHRFNEFIATALDELTIRSGFLQTPDGMTLLDEQEKERVPLAFGSNYERLLDLKRKYDPEDVFRSTIGHLAPSS